MTETNQNQSRRERNGAISSGEPGGLRDRTPKFEHEAMWEIMHIKQPDQVDRHFLSAWMCRFKQTPASRVMVITGGYT